MMGNIAYFIQLNPDECMVWVIFRFYEQNPSDTDWAAVNADPGQTHPGYLSIS